MVAATSASSRPIDKSIIVLNQTISSTQSDTTLITADAPCTISGVRWKFTFRGNVTAAADYVWAIYRLKETYTPPALSQTDNSQLIEPEQEVLTWGVGQTGEADQNAGPVIVHDIGATKTMRKLMKNDRLVFSAIVDGNNVLMLGVVQFFCKF